MSTQARKRRSRGALLRPSRPRRARSRSNASIPKSKIRFHSEVRIHPALKRLILNSTKASLQRLVPRASSKTTIGVSVVTEKTIRTLNRDFRKKDKVTDVLSFWLEPEFQEHLPVLDFGDVILCYERAREQAEENGLELGEELSRLTVHGILHLFGYDHEKGKREAKEMFWLQEKILRKILS